MLTQRSEGLRRLLLICQIWITAGLFWLGVWVMVKFYSPPGGTDLAPLQHLLRVACAGVDLGISGARQLARLSAANRPAAGTSCQSAADGRQYRDARHLPDRDQGRFYLASFPFQFRALFLSDVTFFTSLSSALSGPPVFYGNSPGENLAGWFTGTSGATA